MPSLVYECCTDDKGQEVEDEKCSEEGEMNDVVTVGIG
jgi:hypothetical protein